MMQTAIKKQLVISGCVAVAIILFFSSGLRIPVLDDKTDKYFNDSITKAAAAYAACRGLNAAVSVVKDSNLQIEPAGVGISLALGQVLDPIDDMTERLSDVMVASITSLGVQKLAYEICVSIAPPVIAFLLLAATFLSLLKNQKLAMLRGIAVRLMLLALIARLCLPVSSLANDYLHRNFFSDRIAEARKSLEIASADFDKLMDFSLPRIDGIAGTVKNSAEVLGEKAHQLKKTLAMITDNISSLIGSLLSLTFLYVGVFLIQVVILPLLSFWVLAKTAASLFYKDSSSQTVKKPPRDLRAADLQIN